MRNIILIIITILSLSACSPNGKPTPNKAQLAWQEAEFGVLVCYELHTFNQDRYNQAKARTTKIDNIDQFNPSNLSTDQWVKSAKDAGAKFAILTASHESGFRLWQSDANPYCLKSTKWGNGQRDIVREFYESCEKYDIHPGIYLGTRWNAQLGVYDFKVTGNSPLSQEEYNNLIESEVKEICTNYGDWFEFWFDGGAHGPDQGGPDVLSIVEKYQADALFYHNLERADARWGGSETGMVPYPCWATFPYKSTGAGETAIEHISANNFQLLKTGDPDGKYWMPAMSDAPLRGYGGHEWFWEPDDEHLIYPLNNLVDMYLKSVGRNSTLILGISPDNSGLLPKEDVDRLKQMGDRIDLLFANPLGTTSGKGSETYLKFSESQEVNSIVLQEDIRKGERVRAYLLDGHTIDGWKTIAQGSCIGHKRIEVLDKTVEVSKLRLRITEAESYPRIKNFAAY